MSDQKQQATSTNQEETKREKPVEGIVFHDPFQTRGKSPHEDFDNRLFAEIDLGRFAR